MLDRISNEIYICFMAKIKRPTDINQRAKSIVDITTGEVTETAHSTSNKNPAVVVLGKLG
jgi:hypothetical protein